MAISKSIAEKAKKKVSLTLKQHFSQNSIVMQHYLSEIGLEYSLEAILSQKIWNFQSWCRLSIVINKFEAY